tara:strand:- start:673 stop:924 length:252 start_codon:yes stop_codon:yes gene_type:complete
MRTYGDVFVGFPVERSRESSRPRDADPRLRRLVERREDRGRVISEKRLDLVAEEGFLFFGDQFVLQNVPVERQVELFELIVVF